MIALLCLGLVLSEGMIAGELDRSCPQPASGPCQSIVVRNAEVWLVVGTYERYLGPYVSDAGDLVPRKEAPVRTFHFQNGWSFVQTWGFGGSYRITGPLVFFHFLSPDRSKRLRERGDIIIDDMLVGDVFGVGREMLIASLNGGSAIAVTTRAWMVTPKGPQKVLDVQGKLLRVEKSVDTLRRPLLVLRQPTVQEGGHDDLWRDVVYEWSDANSEFVVGSRETE